MLHALRWACDFDHLAGSEIVHAGEAPDSRLERKCWMHTVTAQALILRSDGWAEVCMACW